MEANTIQQSQDEIIQRFQLLGDWHERYSYLIDLGKPLMRQGEDLKHDKYRLYGCQANVWLKVSFDDEQMFFSGTSDSVIVAGLMALLLQVYSGRTAADIIATKPYFLNETGLIENLSSQRATGLQKMLEQMQSMAVQHIDPRSENA